MQRACPHLLPPFVCGKTIPCCGPFFLCRGLKNVLEPEIKLPTSKIPSQLPTSWTKTFSFQIGLALVGDLRNSFFFPSGLEVYTPLQICSSSIDLISLHSGHFLGVLIKTIFTHSPITQWSPLIPFGDPDFRVFLVHTGTFVAYWDPYLYIKKNLWNYCCECH